MSEKSEAIGQLALALAKCQGQLKKVSKNGIGKVKSKRTNTQFSYSYATLDDVLMAIKAPLSENELSFVQLPETVDGVVYLETYLMHSSGEWIKSTISTRPGGTMSDVQAIGSTITYLRRYAIASIVGVPFGEDDDNQHASPTKKQKTTKRATPTKPRQAVTQKKRVDHAQEQFGREQMADEGATLPPERPPQPKEAQPATTAKVNAALLKKIHIEGNRIYGTDGWLEKKAGINEIYKVTTSKDWAQDYSLSLFTTMKQLPNFEEGVTVKVL